MMSKNELYKDIPVTTERNELAVTKHPVPANNYKQPKHFMGG
jgi:hypothetical protein